MPHSITAALAIVRSVTCLALLIVVAKTSLCQEGHSALQYDALYRTASSKIATGSFSVVGSLVEIDSPNPARDSFLKDDAALKHVAHLRTARIRLEDGSESTTSQVFYKFDGVVWYRKHISQGSVSTCSTEALFNGRSSVSVTTWSDIGSPADTVRVSLDSPRPWGADGRSVDDPRLRLFVPPPSEARTLSFREVPFAGRSVACGILAVEGAPSTTTYRFAPETGMLLNATVDSESGPRFGYTYDWEVGAPFPKRIYSRTDAAAGSKWKTAELEVQEYRQLSPAPSAAARCAEWMVEIPATVDSVEITDRRDDSVRIVSPSDALDIVLAEMLNTP